MLHVLIIFRSIKSGFLNRFSLLPTICGMYNLHILTLAPMQFDRFIQDRLTLRLSFETCMQGTGYDALNMCSSCAPCASSDLVNYIIFLTKYQVNLIPILVSIDNCFQDSTYHLTVFQIIQFLLAAFYYTFWLSLSPALLDSYINFDHKSGYFPICNILGVHASVTNPQLQDDICILFGHLG